MQSVFLAAGRMLIGQGAIDASKIGTSIAIRYACKRPQFGERRVMEYVTHQRRLLPGLASTYAMHLAMLKLKVTPSLCLDSPGRLGFSVQSMPLYMLSTCP